MDTEQATSEKFRKLVQNKRGRLRVKAFADAVDMLSEICREHGWYGSVIRYDGECHAIEGSPEGPPPSSNEKGPIGFKRVRLNKTKEETLILLKDWLKKFAANTISMAFSCVTMASLLFSKAALNLNRAT